MKRYRIVGLAVLVAVVATAALMFASLGSAKPAATMDKVTLQLKWVPQAQFAGYYAAASKGYYKQFGLDVTLKPGGPDITPGRRRPVGRSSASTGCRLLATRDKGSDLVNIAQVHPLRDDGAHSRAGSTRSRRCPARRSASGAAATRTSSMRRS
jgi:NitT/TauT family transport system substrate-binding protein